MIGGHNGNTKNIGVQNMRAENEQKERKGIGLVTHMHSFCYSWRYQFGALLVDRTNCMWREHHSNQIVRDQLDAKLFGKSYEWRHSLRRNLP
eukprot:6561534-Heterocapsa_arctica.AAC.1